jgi:hypothetical protein
MPVTVGGTGFPEPEPASPAVEPDVSPPTDTADRAQLVARIADLTQALKRAQLDRNALRAEIAGLGDARAHRAAADDAYATAVAAIGFLADQCRKTAEHLAATEQTCSALIRDLMKATGR